MSWPATEAELAELGEAIAGAFGGAVASREVRFGDLTLEADAARIIDLLTLLRDEFAFQQLIDICGADYPQRPRRFDVVYHLLSYTKNRRVRVKIAVDEATPVASACPIYPCADWFEREAFDMYGIVFDGHPDLRRLLTDYGFAGHPLRKDFPMTGYVEVRYDDELKRVVYEPVKSVEFRSFDFLSPWEGAGYSKPGQGYDYAVPGDEKAERGK